MVAAIGGCCAAAGAAAATAAGALPCATSSLLASTIAATRSGSTRLISGLKASMVCAPRGCASAAQSSSLLRKPAAFAAIAGSTGAR